MKVLIITNNSLSSTQSNGKTLKSFFKSIPKEDIAQLYFGTNENPDLDACSNYYRITEIDVFKSLLNFSFKTTNTHNVLLKSNSSKEYTDGKLLKFLKRYNKTLSFIRETLWKLNTWNTPELNEWISSFKPDVIFLLAGNCIFVHRIGLKLAKKFKIPFAVYFTDDYVLNDTSTNFVQHYMYKKLCTQYNVTITKADLCYVIGEKMQIDYSRKFNKKFGTLVNAVDFSIFQKKTRNYLDKEKPIIISFIGGIHLNRWRSIVDLGKIADEINHELGLNIIINVFTVVKPDPNVLNQLSQSPINYCGALSYDGVITQIDKSHFLLHVESFDKNNRLYTKYSISTKIPEYLASNRGIIAYGPHEVASIELLKDNNFGCCITDLDSKAIMKEKLLNSIMNYNTINIDRNYDYSYNNYNQEIVATSLVTDLKSITEHL